MNASVMPETRMNVDEFLAWCRRQPDAKRYELVDGKVIAMAGDSVRHNLTKSAAWRALDDSVRTAGLPCVVFVDGVGIRIDNNRMRIPDVLVQCGKAPDPDALTVDHPLIVVEVVSPSSEGDDVESKLLDYFSLQSIRHYLIIHSKERAIVHHQRNERGTLNTRIAHVGEEIVLNPPGVTVFVDALLGPASSGNTETG